MRLPVSTLHSSPSSTPPPSIATGGFGDAADLTCVSHASLSLVLVALNFAPSPEATVSAALERGFNFATSVVRRRDERSRLSPCPVSPSYLVLVAPISATSVALVTVACPRSADSGRRRDDRSGPGEPASDDRSGPAARHSLRRCSQLARLQPSTLRLPWRSSRRPTVLAALAGSGRPTS